MNRLYSAVHGGNGPRDHHGHRSVLRLAPRRSFHFSHPRRPPDRRQRTPYYGPDCLMLALFLVWLILTAIVLSGMRHMQVISPDKLARPLVLAMRPLTES